MTSPIVLYEKSQDGKATYLTLNCPDRLNAMTEELPHALRAAVRKTSKDPAVYVIVLKGAGKSLYGGYDLRIFVEDAERETTGGSQDVPRGYDPLVDYLFMKENTECFAELFHGAKPTVAEVHGTAVAGESDIALCCDLVVMTEDTRIGYPPARVWRCPTTAMWMAPVGVEKAKRLLLTETLARGRKRRLWGLCSKLFLRISWKRR
ncbi:ClpP/crotonase [Corynespora cassiicola Philippines]|uniref:ClpP/crotonase n=1 Tax=Corynespora cassiicola Philippines TaxID=1448308 RepID=A0A2T2N8Q2_CORCC|nr:ClpP/crotonase [Corynespora cassiicola Philippines]